jgi:acyl-CoA synthetase
MVEQAAVIPITDPRLGERVCLAIVWSANAQPDPNAILDHLAAAGVSRYDMPEFIVFPSEMPLTASGKIVKRDLVRWVTEGRVQPQPVHRRLPAAAGG